MDNKHIVIVGATSLIAEHCARLWVQERALLLTLIGRNQQKLAAIAADLRVRNPRVEIVLVVADFFAPAAIEQLVTDIVLKHPPDMVLVAQGALPNQALCQTDLTVCAEALAINAHSPVLFAEAFVRHFAQVGRGTIGIIGSVAGDRGRKSNYIYGAAKGLVTRYVQGLQHRFARTAVHVVLINPGPTDTPMTAGFKQQGMQLAPVEQVARDIVRAMARGTPLLYTPGRWRWIMSIVCLIPAFVFNRLDI